MLSEIVANFVVSRRGPPVGADRALKLMPVAERIRVQIGWISVQGQESSGERKVARTRLGEAYLTPIGLHGSPPLERQVRHDPERKTRVVDPLA